MSWNESSIGDEGGREAEEKTGKWTIPGRRLDRCLSLVIVWQWSLFVVGRCLSLVIVSCWLLFVAGRCLALVVVKENIFQPQIFLFTTNALFCVYVQN